MTPPQRNRARSKSDPLGYPPDNWIPVADEKAYIAMPAPHHMSPSPSPVTMEPPVRAQSTAPIPPPPIVTEETTTETSVASETSSETIPPQSAVRAKDYAHHALKLRERDEQQPQRSRTPTPLSPGSTRMSDYGILSSPQVDQRRTRAPVQHFEIERSTTPLREKMNRSWSMRKQKEVTSVLIGILLCQLLIGCHRACLLHLSAIHRFLLLLQRMQLLLHDRGDQANPRCPKYHHLRPRPRRTQL